MKILFALPGHLKTVPMGQNCVDALRALGHEVTAFDFRPTWRDRLAAHLGRSTEEKPAMNKRLRWCAAKLRPDVFISLFGFDISRETLRFLRAEHVPTACWWINDPFQLERALRKAPWYDYLFSNAAGTLPAYRAAGVAQAHFLPTACEPDINRPAAARPEWRSQVCFAGDWSPLREQVMTQLAAEFEVRVFGPWGRKLAPGSPLRAVLHDGFFSPAEMSAMFASSTVVLNVHTWYGKFDYGVNPRLFEAAACGSYQLVDWKQEIPTLFDCTREVVCYRRVEDIAGAVRTALALDPSERRAIAQAARERALAEHTYRHRMAQLLAVMGR